MKLLRFRSILFPCHRGAQLLRVVRSELGQATAEYALVMLAAAALAGLLLAWASGTDGIERLLDAVMDSLIAEADG